MAWSIKFGMGERIWQGVGGGHTPGEGDLCIYQYDIFIFYLSINLLPNLIYLSIFHHQPPFSLKGNKVGEKGGGGSYSGVVIDRVK